jgi:hypothetical protein
MTIVYKSLNIHATYRDLTVSRGRATAQTQLLHTFCDEIDPTMPKTHLKMKRCYAD